MTRDILMKTSMIVRRGFILIVIICTILISRCSGDFDLNDSDQRDFDPNTLLWFEQPGVLSFVANLRGCRNPAHSNYATDYFRMDGFGDDGLIQRGVWNTYMNPNWDSKYTTHINTEMNCWPAEVGNITECNEPLFTMIEELTDQGEDVAREHYGARGWVFHQDTDLWRVAASMDGPDWGHLRPGERGCAPISGNTATTPGIRHS